MRKDEPEYFREGKLVALLEELLAAFALVPRAPGYVELPTKESGSE